MGDLSHGGQAQGRISPHLSFNDSAEPKLFASVKAETMHAELSDSDLLYSDPRPQ